MSLAQLRVRARAVLHAEAGVPVSSPCISVCRMDTASGLCAGCLRSLDEIAAWSTLPNAARRDVWARIAQRASPGTAPRD